jgi:hypothetical protein
MHRYTVVEQVYRRTPTHGSVPEQGVLRLQAAIIDLYSKIIEYQARAACKFYRNRLSQFLRDSVKVDNLESLIVEVKEADQDCAKYFPLLDSNLLQNEFTDQNGRHERLLQALENNFSKLQSTIHEEQEGQRNWQQSDVKHRLTKQTSKFLRALCDSIDYEANKTRNPKPVKNTCRWVLDNPKFGVWRRGETPGLLWISADPGCGKSVLSRFLADEVLTGERKHYACYFFFKRDDSARRTSDALRALLHQVLTLQPSLLKDAITRREGKLQHLQRDYLLEALLQHEGNAQLFHSGSFLWKILLQVAADPEVEELVCVVDALDECHDPQSLISNLTELFGSSDSSVQDEVISKHKLKFVLTSRPYTTLERGEQGIGKLVRTAPEIRLSHDEKLSYEAIKDEINLYIQHHVSLIAQELELDGEVKNHLESRLLSLKNRTYLWLHLVLPVIQNNLKGSTQKAIDELIDELPPSVELVYESILKHVPDSAAAKKLLHIVTAAMRPLTVRELRVALAIDEQSTTYVNLDLEPVEKFKVLVRNRCGLFISILDEKVYLIHQTARDFLLSPNTAPLASSHLWKHSIFAPDSHEILARICACYLMFSEFDTNPYASAQKELLETGKEDDRRISDESDSSEESEHSNQSMITYHPQFWEDESKRMRFRRHEFLEYASGNWIQHFNISNGSGASIEDNSRLWRLCDPQESLCKNWVAAKGREDLDLGEFGRILPGNVARKEVLKPRSLVFCASVGFILAIDILLKIIQDVGDISMDSSSQALKHLALKYAIREGHLAVVKKIMSSGHMDVNQEFILGSAEFDERQELELYKWYNTPLGFAIRKQDLPMIRYLLSMGANPGTSDDQESMLHGLLQGYTEKTAEIVKLLLENGANVNASGLGFASPLKVATRLGLHDICEILMSFGGEIIDQDMDLFWDYCLEHVGLQFSTTAHDINPERPRVQQEPDSQIGTVPKVPVLAVVPYRFRGFQVLWCLPAVLVAVGIHFML